MSSIQEPPHDDDAERALLGAALFDVAALDEAIERLEADDFYRERHRHIWRAMCALHERGASDLDALTVADQLDDDGSREAAGGMEYLVRLSDEVPSAANAEQYMDIVQRNARHRAAISRLGTHMQELKDDRPDVDGVLEDVASDAHDLLAGGGEDTMVDGQEMAELAYRKIEGFHSDDGGDCVPTGFIDIDKQLDGGPDNGDLVVLAGRPGMGKTSLALAMQRRQTVDDDYVALFGSLEMTKAKVGVRHMAGLADVPYRKLKRGDASARDWSKLTDVAGEMTKSSLYTSDEPSITPQKLLAKARRTRAEAGRLDVIYVDYLQLMSASGDHGNREEEVASISASLKAIAKLMGVPVIALAQLNRGVESRENKRPKLSDFRESGAIEQDADVAAFLYRDSYYEDDGDSADRGVAELIFRKNRNGAPGTVRLAWKPTVPTFDDLDDWHEQGGRA